MIAAVIDTHAAIWYLAPDRRLSATARVFIDTATTDRKQIALSSISLVEMVYLIEKHKIPTESLRRLEEALQADVPTFVEIPVALPFVHALSQVSSAQIPDMPDRIIAATALHLGVPVISRDGRIQASSIQTIW